MRNEEPPVVSPGDSPVDSRDPYARDFRVIGHDLEAKGVDDFELESAGVNYHVLGKTKVSQSPKKGFIKALRSFGENLPGLGSKPATAESLKLLYTPDSISNLKKEHQQKRQETDAMPTAHSLSQILRAVGSYLDLKKARLLRIKKQGPWITLEYELEQGKRVAEEFTVSTLYDFCVRMYLQRKGRKRRG